MLIARPVGLSLSFRHQAKSRLLLLLLLAASWRVSGSALDVEPIIQPNRGPSSTRRAGGKSREQRTLQAAAAITPRLTEPGRAILLYTQFGVIRIMLLERLAPRVTGMVWALAATRNCTSAHSCAFYRCTGGPCKAGLERLVCMNSRLGTTVAHAPTAGPAAHAARAGMRRDQGPWTARWARLTPCCRAACTTCPRRGCRLWILCYGCLVVHVSRRSVGRLGAGTCNLVLLVGLRLTALFGGHGCDCGP